MISSFQTCKADLGIAFSETIVFIFPDFINLFHLLPFSPSSHSSITLSIPLAQTFQMCMHLKPQAHHSVTKMEFSRGDHISYIYQIYLMNISTISKPYAIICKYVSICMYAINYPSKQVCKCECASKCKYASMQTQGKSQAYFQLLANLMHFSGRYQISFLRQILDIRKYHGESLGKSQNISGIFAYMFTILKHFSIASEVQS